MTRDPSSGSFIQCLAKITVMVLLCPLTWMKSMLWQHICPWCMCVLHGLEREKKKVLLSSLEKRTVITEALQVMDKHFMSSVELVRARANKQQ